ncbi:MAG: hypothetical protein ACLQVG_32065, partial [Terriglobia bacterium]
VPSAPPSAGKRRRQKYSLTNAGRACLREWLAVPFQNDPPRNEFLLKLFFGWEAAPGVSAGHIRELQEKNRGMLATLSKLDSFVRTQSAGQNPHLPYWMLTLSLGIALTRTALEWGESALAVLASADATAAPNPQPVAGNPPPDHRVAG